MNALPFTITSISNVDLTGWTIEHYYNVLCLTDQYNYHYLRDFPGLEPLLRESHPELFIDIQPRQPEIPF